jgi:hypothetical protein
MSTREAQAFNDGKLAFRQGVEIGLCPRRSMEQRAAWRAGFEDEQRRAITETAPPARLEEARGVLAKLKEAVAKL